MTAVTYPVLGRRDLVLGYLAAVASAAGYGAGTYIGLIVVNRYAPPVVGSAFALLAAFIVLAALFHRDVIADLALAPRRAWVLISLSGIASAWGATFLYMGLSVAPVVVVAPISGAYPPSPRSS